MLKVIAFAVNTLLQLAGAGAGLFFLLLSLNGYSERQATPGLVLYAGLGLVSALGLGLGSAMVVNRLAEKTSLGSVAVTVASVLGFAALGAVILGVGFFAAIFLSEAMRG